MIQLRSIMFFPFFLSLFIMTEKAFAQSPDLEILQTKCLLEIKYGFVPRNCYSWLKTSHLNPEKISFFNQWFDSSCKKTLEKNDDHVQYHIRHFKVLSSQCQQQFATAFKQWSYKARHDSPDKVFNVLVQTASEVGKDIEYTSPHDLEKTKRNTSIRGIRRRIN